MAKDNRTQAERDAARAAKDARRYSMQPDSAPDPIVLTDDDEALLARVGEPGLNPAANAEWANNSAAAWAAIYQRAKGLDARERGKLAMSCIDRIGRTTTKATHAEEIRDLKNKAGLTARAKPDAARLVPINGGVPLRASGRIQRGAPVSGSMPDTEGEGHQ